MNPDIQQLEPRVVWKHFADLNAVPRPSKKEFKRVLPPKAAAGEDKAAAEGQSANVDAHTQTQALKLHHSELGPDGKFTKSDEIIRLDDEPDHDGLCYREQQYFLKAIRDDLDLSDHMEDALSSMRTVAAADESFRTGKTIEL